VLAQCTSGEIYNSVDYTPTVQWDYSATYDVGAGVDAYACLAACGCEPTGRLTRNTLFPATFQRLS
jgi:hypothetical protein